MALNLAPCPPSLKPIQHYLKTATEHETRDPVIAYWCRLTALQTGLGLDKSSKVFSFTEMEFKEFEPRFKSAKIRIRFSGG